MRRTIGLVAFGAWVLAAGAACAQADIVSRDTLHGIAEVSLSAADGEKSWLDRGFGKSGVGGDGRGGWKLRPELSEAALEWKPHFSFAVGAVVTAQLQPKVNPALDIGEAYLTLRAPPQSYGRFSARLGVFYPPVSLENDGVAWTNPDMLSSSAINSWIGEEVKVTGLEATWRQDFGDHEIAASAAVFGWNDTSGTLLSFRGWALGSVKAGVRTKYDLPPLSVFMQTKQGPQTEPFYELDGRSGYYGRLEWRPPAPVVVQALYYDNLGNRIAVDDELQWAWSTHFLSLGAKWDPDARTTIAAQALSGRTRMGYVIPGGIWLDMNYRSAYLLAKRRFGADTLSGRVDLFDTTDHTFIVDDNNNETGWALTGTWRHRLMSHFDLLLEAQHIASNRPARALAGDAARQDQTILQSALRLTF